MFKDQFILGMSVWTTKELSCLHDIHEIVNYPRPNFEAKPPIPKGEEVTVVQQFTNLVEGQLVRVKYNDKHYDVKPFHLTSTKPEQ